MELLAISDATCALRDRLAVFMRDVVEPGELEYRRQHAGQDDRWRAPPIIKALKQLARDAGLWNLCVPDGRHGAGLSNLDCAALAELMGRSPIAAEVFNCSAPDSGNMDMLLHFGTPAQQQRWLAPLLAGDIRSAFAIAEPGDAAPEPAGTALRARRDGADYVLDGHARWVTGAADPRCRLLIVMAVTAPDGQPRQRHSMLLVPSDASGLDLVRCASVFGYDDAPGGHVELRFDAVRVPATHLLGEAGGGLAIAQARLGPERIHQCMRLVGLARRALELMVERARGTDPGVAARGMLERAIVESRCEIEQARLLTLAAADQLDRLGHRAAREALGMAMLVTPATACRVFDRAIQWQGAAGLDADCFLAAAYAHARRLRLADGPDGNPLEVLAQAMLKIPRPELPAAQRIGAVG